MADKKKKGSQPPTSSVHGTQPGQNVSVREIVNPAYVEADRPQQGKKAPLPLPDYETLFPNKRHGVQGQTKWDHVIAEVNQKHRDTPLQFLEMSVDGPEEQEPNPRSSISQESPTMKHYKTYQQETKPIPTKTVAAPAPPLKPVTSSHPQSVADSNQKQSQSIARQSLLKPNPPAATGPGNTDALSREKPSRDEARKVLLSSTAATHAPRPSSQIEKTPPDDQRKAPTAKPRQRVSGKEPTQQEESAVTPNKSMDSNVQTLSSSSVSIEDKKSEQIENFADFNPFPSSDLLPKDPWAQPMQNQEVDDIFTAKRKEEKPEDQGMTDNFDKIFSQQKPADPFAGFNGSDSNKQSENRKSDDDSNQASPVFQRNLQRTKKIVLSSSHLNNKGSKPQEQAYEKGEIVTSASQDLHAGEVTNVSVTPQPQADVKVQSNFYGKDLFGAEPFTVPSGLTSSQPLQVVMEESASQSGGLSGGKTLLRAWVSPSEIPPVSAQNSNGGGLALTPRR